MVATHTWDGQPIAADEPHGASVVVRRPGPAGWQYLILHRAHHGADYAGDWAWTQPTGARQPGEPIRPGALREMAEEAGLTDVPVWPVDLSGQWARFAAEVPADTAVRLVDPEHDAFRWVSAAEAERRCTPAFIGAGIAAVDRLPAVALAFRPLRRDDLPRLAGWLSAEHVAPWFGQSVPVEAKYGPRLEPTNPVRVHVVEVDGAPAGFVQHQAEPTGAVGIDFVLGDPGLIGRGIGPRVLWSYVDTVLRRQHPDATVLADPDPANRASVRALEKAGFRAGELRAGRRICRLDPGRCFGPAPA